MRQLADAKLQRDYADAVALLANLIEKNDDLYHRGWLDKDRNDLRWRYRLAFR